MLWAIINAMLSSLHIEFPKDLPVSTKRDEIMAALAAHQVTIVCGKTGSGKTTQLPKIALATRVRHQIPFSPVFDPSTLTKSST